MRWRFAAVSYHLRHLRPDSPEVLRGERDQRLAHVLGAAIRAFDRVDQLVDRRDIAELDDRLRRCATISGSSALTARRAFASACVEVRDRISGQRFDRHLAHADSPDRTTARRA
jgi:hypothetical protein